MDKPIGKLQKGEFRESAIVEKINELVDRYNNHVHEVGNDGGVYPLKTTGLPKDIGHRTDQSP